MARKPKMKSFRLSLRLVGVLASLPAIGCGYEPAAPSGDAAPAVDASTFFRATQARSPKSIADQWRDLSVRVPGFQSIYYDSDGQLTINSTRLDLTGAERTTVVDWARHYTAAVPYEVSPAINRVPWDYRTLYQHYQTLIMALGTFEWATTTRIDDIRGTIVITVDPISHAQDVRRIAATLGIPNGMVQVDQLGLPKREATVQDFVRPVNGGLQVWFSGIPCTLGLNGYKTDANGWPDTSQPVFTTASHCTDTPGTVTGTAYGQPNAANPIGTEIFQPTVFSGAGCPYSSCQHADVAVAEYLPGVSAGYGKVEKTNIGSLTITGLTSILNTYGALTGQTVWKVGRTTGSSSGTVLATCVDIPPVGIYAGVLCNQSANYNSDGGDSGAPVWVPYSASNPNGTPAIGGVHHSRSGSTRYFSPINQIWYVQSLQGVNFYW